MNNVMNQTTDSAQEATTLTTAYNVMSTPEVPEENEGLLLEEDGGSEIETRKKV